jgi:hypothetical protein
MSNRLDKLLLPSFFQRPDACRVITMSKSLRHLRAEIPYSMARSASRVQRVERLSAAAGDLNLPMA